MLTIACFFFGAAVAALLTAFAGQEANQERAFAWFLGSVALAAVLAFPWKTLLAGAGRRLTTRNARGAHAGQGVGIRILAGLRRAVFRLCSATLSGLRSLVAGIGALAQKHPAFFLTGVLLAGTAWFGAEKLTEEVNFGTLSVFFLLLHATVAAFLVATGLLSAVLRFLGRNFLFAWLYLFAWVLLFAAVKMDDLGFMWYRTFEFWAAVAGGTIGARIIYGNVHRQEWMAFTAVAVVFAGYFLLSNKEYDLGSNVAWVVAGSFGLLLTVIAFGTYKGVNKYFK